ncbi:MAG TPA: glutamate--cysteine ligase [Thermopetrobacter sp.]|nr:glutamate--cysteine ligase [Thermopetrobacter sp.]
MSDSDSDSDIITGREPLIAWLEAGCKPRAAWRIGTEHEKFPFLTDTLRPVPYDGPRSIRALLEGLRDRHGWEPIMEDGAIIGLRDGRGGSITLEPGGQFELSGAAVENLHQTCEEVHEHLAHIREIGDRLGIGFLGLGFSPLWTLAETPMMPKGRYRIMRAYMARTGRLGRDMMFRSATVQVNLDFGSEADMVRKFRVSLALQPVVTALFANSPFTDGRPNGYLSWRSAVWLDTDPDRTGMLPFVFEDGFGFERYVDYALDVPMYFVHRDGAYIDATGMSFRDFMRGELPALPGELPTLKDWEDHLSTIFPEVRLKRFLEMRGADSGPWRTLCALPALWTGLLYDDAALDAAWDLVRRWTAEDRQRLREEVPKKALAAEVAGRGVREVAREMLAIARGALERRNRIGCKNLTEARFLDVLDEIVASGRTHAEELLALYHGRWEGDVRHVFRDFAF